MLRADKAQSIEQILSRMKESDTYFLLDFRGLTVADITDLRGRLRQSGASLRVVKNTLAKRAAVDAELTGLEAFLAGPSAIVFCGEDPAAPAKAIQTFIKEKKKAAVKGGLLERRPLGAPDIEGLASLPGKDVLVAQVVGGIVAPLYGLVGVLNGPIRGLVVALDQVRQEKEKAA